MYGGLVVSWSCVHHACAPHGEPPRPPEVGRWGERVR